MKHEENQFPFTGGGGVTDLVSLNNSYRSSLVKLKRLTVMSKGKALNFFVTIACFGMSNLFNKLSTHFQKHPFSGH